MVQSNPKIVFSDFDGTLTTHERLGAVFWDILDLLQTQQIDLVIVSGRSKSWGQFLVTHFPVKAAIMEGGGSIVVPSQEEETSVEYLVSSDHLKRIKDFVALLQRELPQIKLTSDSFGRAVDRAISLEFLQNKDPSGKLKEQLVALFQRENIHYSFSSIHVNFWSGEVSKSKGAKYYLEHYARGVSADQCVFYGDAPNDEDAFKFFTRSVGVSNIKKYLSKINHQPKTILQGPENAGPLGVLNHLREMLHS